MDSKTFGKVLENRTKGFAIRVVKLSAQLPDTPEDKVVRNQISKSGTSVGAYYRKANRARSRADFKNKIKICESEASETNYWLEIILGMNWIAEKEIDEIQDESEQLLRLFSAIGAKD